MSLFKFRTPVNSKGMAIFIYDNVKTRMGTIESIFDKIGAVYDELENQLVVMAINYEIIRWELSKSNPRVIVDNVINDVYDKFFSSLKVDESAANEYRDIMNAAQMEMAEVLFSIQNKLTQKTFPTYQVLLRVQGISFELVDRITEQELLYTIENWYSIAKQMNELYKIVDKEEDKKMEQPIDFDF